MPNDYNVRPGNELLRCQQLVKLADAIEICTRLRDTYPQARTAVHALTNLMNLMVPDEMPTEVEVSRAG